MKENIFENTKFGKKFRVNDFCEAIYHGKTPRGSHHLILSDGSNLYCKDDGKDYNDGRYIIGESERTSGQGDPKVAPESIESAITKTRTRANEKYWYIKFTNTEIVVEWEYESDPTSNTRYTYGNYFTTEEQALAVAEMIRKVLEGADVIEMPSEVEIERFGKEFADNNHITVSEQNDKSDYSSLLWGYETAIAYLKSKIIK